MANPHYQMDDRYNEKSDFIEFLINQFKNATKRDVRKVLYFKSEENARKYYNENIKNSQFSYYRCFSCFDSMLETALEKTEPYLKIEKIDNGSAVFPCYILLS